MKKGICISILLVLGVFAFRMNNISGHAVSEQQGLPSGKWSFSAHPFTGKGYESRPVIVTSVKTEFRSLSVTAVRVRNISSKRVSALRFAWYLSRENDQKNILKQGETPVTYVDHGLATGEAKTMKLPIVSFVEIYQPLLRNKQLEGDYRVDIAAVEVMFDDQSKWTPNQEVAVVRRAGGTVMVKIAYGTLEVTPLEHAPPCAQQKCKFVEGPPDTYKCENSENEEYCTNCFTSCCNTLCIDPTPACNCN
jgi:hypothetical protein